MEEKQANVPYFVHEGVVTRMYKMFKLTVISLALALAVTVTAFVVNDCLWRKYCSEIEARYQTEVTDAGVYEQPNSGVD